MSDIDVNVFRFFSDYFATRGYRRPKSAEMLDKRNDKKFFYKLYQFLVDGEKENSRGRKAFLQYVYFHEQDKYNSVDLVTHFEELYASYKSHSYSNEMAYLARIYNSFKFIDKFCEQSGITDAKSYFEIGSPPIALKHYKEGKVDEAIVCFGCDVDVLKKKIWFKIYVGELKRKLGMIKTRIKYSPKIISMLQDNFDLLYCGEYESPLFRKKSK